MLNHIKNILSVTLQVSNANILLQSMQNLHMVRYESEISLYENSDKKNVTTTK
jgi:hypothetical protein